jgi:hypothetical protein
MQFKNIFYLFFILSYVQNHKMYTLVTMLQDETKLCDSTVLKIFAEGVPVAINVKH